jgi:hypothetical protein
MDISSLNVLPLKTCNMTLSWLFYTSAIAPCRPRPISYAVIGFTRVPRSHCAVDTKQSDTVRFLAPTASAAYSVLRPAHLSTSVF